MSLLRRMTERRDGSPEDPRYPLTSSFLVDWLTSGSRSDSGVSVTPEKAMKFSAVYRAVALLSGTGASLPIHGYDRNQDRKRVTVPLLENPHPEMTPFEFWELMWTYALLIGNAAAQKIHNSSGHVIQLWPIHPTRIKYGRASDGTKVFEVTGDDGQHHALTSQEIFHVPGLGYDGIQGLSVVECARQAIGLGIAAESFGARFFGKGAMLSGVLTTDQPLDQEKADRLKDRWQKKIGGLDRAHEIAVLDRGAKFQPVSVPARDAQFLESRKFQVTEVARWFGVPPHMLYDVERSTSWGSGIEQQGLGFLIYTLRPWLTRFAQRINRELVRPNVYAEHVTEALLQTDIKTRYAAYATGRQWGWLTVNDIHKKENEEPVEGGDTYMMPSNMKPMGEDTLKERSDALGTLVRSGYDPAAAAALLGLDVPHTGRIPVTLQPEKDRTPQEEEPVDDDGDNGGA